MPHLLARAECDADAARDDPLDYVRQRPGDPGGVLVVDEAGLLRSGPKSCGAARQHGGTTGRSGRTPAAGPTGGPPPA